MTTTHHLSNLFLRFGLVRSVKILMDHITGHSLGLGYVEMDILSGTAAISELHTMKFMNYYISVTEAPV